MTTLSALLREAGFAARDRSVWSWMIIVLGLSALAVGYGLAEVEQQNATIQALIQADRENRESELSKQKDWGSAAYYGFHLTYNPPSDFAYAAMGMRDAQPWKHRIRMLALEGQIYERDVGNPSVALIGRFDFAFLAAFLVPLVLIILLYDLRASEKIAGRHDLLESLVGRSSSFWVQRASVRMGALYLCLMLPLTLAGLMSGTDARTLVLANLLVLMYVIFWTGICLCVSSWRQPGSVILSSLIAIWLATAVIMPAAARFAIDHAVPIPSGADILMLQRETVNDAWDLPRETTMQVFFEQHPEWSDYEKVEGSFEWQWYYAFQQVGDQRVEELARAYRLGSLERARVAAWVSLLAPPLLLETALQSLAKTDLRSSVSYLEQVRAYHAALRGFYYPKFFRHEPFDGSALDNLPEFRPDAFSATNKS